MDALALFKSIPLVPVVVIEDAAVAVPLAQTLLNAGIAAMEITLRTEAALDAIEAVASRVPEMLLGAGSLRTPDQFQQVVDRGARFGVSPGSSDDLLNAAHKTALPFVPGAVTATEILRLQGSGYQLCKFFPAELAGGIPMIKALSAPLPEVRFFPTGGINQSLAVEYLSLPQVVSVGGSWFVPAGDLLKEKFDTIGQLAREAVEVTGG